MRRLAVALLSLALLAMSAPLAALRTPPRIGVIWLGGLPSPPLPPTSPLSLLSQSLRALGYVEGQNIAIESRFMGRRPVTDVVAELVQLRVDVIVAMSTAAAWAAKNTTTTVPVVFSTVGDPVELGLIRSLARPGGNLTGTHLLSGEQSGKRLALLKEAVPQMRRVGVLWNPADGAWEFRETEAAARALALQVQPVPVRRSEELDAAFQAAVNGSVEGLTVLTTPALATAQRRIADLCLKNRLAAIYWQQLFAEVGGLMAYGPSASEQMQRVASYIDRILRGARPADLPVEQPTRFELVINLKTAKALGLTIPPSVLARADEVIQ